MTSLRTFLREGGVTLTLFGILAVEGIAIWRVDSWHWATVAVFCAMAVLNGIALFFRMQGELVYDQDGRRREFGTRPWWLRLVTRRAAHSIFRDTIGGYRAGIWTVEMVATTFRRVAWAHLVFLGLARFAAGLPLVPAFVYGGG